MVAEGTPTAEIGEEGAAAQEEVPTIIITANHLLLLITPTPTLLINLIRKGQSTQTYRPVLGGRALSTGRRGGAHLTVLTPSSASGCKSLHLVLPPPEILANLM